MAYFSGDPTPSHDGNMENGTQTQLQRYPTTDIVNGISYWQFLSKRLSQGRPW